MRALPCMLCSRYPVILTVDHIMHILHSQDVHRVYGLRSLRRSFHRADNDILRARHARTRSAGVPSEGWSLTTATPTGWGWPSGRRTARASANASAQCSRGGGERADHGADPPGAARRPMCARAVDITCRQSAS